MRGKIINFVELQHDLRAIGKKVDNLATAVEQMRPKTADKKRMCTNS